MILAIVLSALATEPHARAIPMRGGLLLLLPAPEDGCYVRTVSWTYTTVLRGPGGVQTRTVTQSAGGDNASASRCDFQTLIEPGPLMPFFLEKFAPTVFPTSVNYEIEGPKSIWKGQARLEVERLPPVDPSLDRLGVSLSSVGKVVRLQGVNRADKALLLGGFGRLHRSGDPCEYPSVLLRPGEEVHFTGRTEGATLVYYTHYSSPDLCTGLSVEAPKK